MARITKSGKRIPKNRIRSSVLDTIGGGNITIENRNRLFGAISRREWENVRTVLNDLGIEMRGNPSRFKTVVLKLKEQRGQCKSIWRG